MRRLLAVPALLLFAACSGGPGADLVPPGVGPLSQFFFGLPGAQPEFGTTGLAETPTEPGYAEFNNASPGVPAEQAAALCTLGYVKTAQTTVPGETTPLTSLRVRCNPYRPSLL